MAAVTIGQEDETDGFVGPLSAPGNAILVGSDGEEDFLPFGVTEDVTDAIQFTRRNNWAWDGRFGAPGLWQQLDANTWFVSAAAVGENEPPVAEPVGHWYFVPGDPWAPGTPMEQWILDSEGSISDVVILDNSGPNGGAAITFSSDPFTSAAVPEATSAIVFLLVGLPGGLAARYFAKKREEE